jgi:hypothetical protein
MLQKINLQVLHSHNVIIDMYFVTVHTQPYNVINQAVSFRFFYLYSTFCHWGSGDFANGGNVEVYCWCSMG